MARRRSRLGIAAGCALAVAAHCPVPATGAALAETRYCVPVDAFDFNPFRPINDGKELAYLIFLRSFISTVPDEPGILSQYEFSPDGRRFQGRVHESARWDDGAPLTSKEAARSIARGLRHRPIGRRVRVTGERILDERNFELQIESSMENVTGALREALSTNSRQNRLWAARFKASASAGKMEIAVPVEVLGRHPFRYKGGKPGFAVGAHFVRLTARAECASSDYGMYQESLSSDMAGYEMARSGRPQAVTFEPNTRKMSLAKRKAVAAWIRAAFRAAPGSSGLETVPGFFLLGEPGFEGGAGWPVDERAAWVEEEPLILGVENPVFRAVLDDAARRQKRKVLLIDFPLQDADVDGQVLSSAIHDGRQIILQDFLKWRFVEEFMAEAPRTRASLRLIAARSASTIPPDAAILRDFEKAARAEHALVPVARRFPQAFTKRSAPLRLEWRASGEPLFSAK